MSICFASGAFIGEALQKRLIRGGTRFFFLLETVKTKTKVKGESRCSGGMRKALRQEGHFDPCHSTQVCLPLAPGLITSRSPSNVVLAGLRARVLCVCVCV